MGEKMKIDNVVIYCENREELISVLEYLEEYTDKEIFDGFFTW